MDFAFIELLDLRSHSMGNLFQLGLKSGFSIGGFRSVSSIFHDAESSCLTDFAFSVRGSVDTKRSG